MAGKCRILYIQRSGLPCTVVRSGMFERQYHGNGYKVDYLDLDRWTLVDFIRALTPPILIKPVAKIIKYCLMVRQYWWLHFRVGRYSGIVLMKYFSLAQVALIRKNTDAKLLYDIDDPVWQPSYGLKSDDVFEIFRLVDAVAVDNEYLAAIARQYNKNVFILPPFAQYEGLPDGPSENSDEVVLGWIGSGSTSYMLYSIREVLENLAERHPNISLLVLGAYSMPLPFFEKIRIRGAAEYTTADMNKARRSIDIGLFPLIESENALGRGLGKPIIYMGAAIPVVATRFGLTDTLIRDGENGFLAANSVEWSEKLEQLIEDKALRERIGQAGFETVHKKFSIENNFKIMQDNFLSKL